MEPVGLLLDRADHVVEAFGHAVGDTVLEVVLDPSPASFDRLEDVNKFRNAALQVRSQRALLRTVCNLTVEVR